MKPVTAKPSSNAVCSARSGTQSGQAKRPAPTPMNTIIHSTKLSALSLRLASRPLTAATA